MKQQPIKDPITNLLAEFSARLNETEEKQRLVKDRILLIGENLISTKEESVKQELEFKKQINELSDGIKEIKQLNSRILNELANFARKTEVRVLERQMKMFEPLKLARLEDVEKLVKKEVEKQTKK